MMAHGEETTDLEKEPVKLFIKDIDKLKFDSNNKYIVHLHGMKFKNVRLHGVITDVLSLEDGIINIELSDATGRVSVFHNQTKCRIVSNEKWRQIHSERTIVGETPNAETLNWMKESIAKQIFNVNFSLGDYVSVVGDIFVESLTGSKCVSAFELKKSTITMDVLWMQDLVHIYNHHYKNNNV